MPPCVGTHGEVCPPVVGGTSAAMGVRLNGGISITVWLNQMTQKCSKSIRNRSPEMSVSES